MKKLLVSLLTLFSSSCLMALNGVCCHYGPNPNIPNSYNYQSRYFVECYCDCTNTMHQCMDCKHFHAPKEDQFIVGLEHAPLNKQTSLKPPPTQKAAFAYLATAIKSRKKSE